MGDKTQLAAVFLAIKYSAPFEVWAGATLGMLAANAPGIILGTRLGAHLPQKTIKLIAAGMFLAFGAVTLHGSL